MKMSLGLEYLQIQILCSVLSFASLCHFLCLVSFFFHLRLLLYGCAESGSDTWGNFNGLGIPMKAVSVSAASMSDWLPSSAKRKKSVLCLQMSVDNIKPGGHDLSLQGSQIRLYLVSLPQPRPLSVSYAHTFFFCLFGDMHDSRAKNTFGRELQSYRRRQMHHSHWSSWDPCV